MKKAQHLMALGELERARTTLCFAMNATFDDADKRPTESAELLPRIKHRVAQLHDLTGEVEAADICFTEAESLFDRSNVIGRAITMRDHGWAAWQWGDWEKAEKLIPQAHALLLNSTSINRRLRLELAVTKGFEARLFASEDPDKARRQFLAVDRKIRGGTKWVYELDNLRQLVDCLPLKSQPLYRLRIRQLSLQMIIVDEVGLTTRDVIDGNFGHAIFGTTLRNIRRISPI